MNTGETVTVRDAKMARNGRVNLELGCRGQTPAGNLNDMVFYMTGDELEINLARS